MYFTISSRSEIENPDHLAYQLRFDEFQSGALLCRQHKLSGRHKQGVLDNPVMRPLVVSFREKNDDYSRLQMYRHLLMAGLVNSGKTCKSRTVTGVDNPLLVCLHAYDQPNNPNSSTRNTAKPEEVDLLHHGRARLQTRDLK